MKRIFVLALLLILAEASTSSLLALETAALLGEKSKVIGTKYVKVFYGIIHQHPLKDSITLTTLACGQKVNVLDYQGAESERWDMVQFATHTGFLQKDFLSERFEECLNFRYPKFFHLLDLSVAEQYYWAKLYDNWDIGRTKVR